MAKGGYRGRPMMGGGMNMNMMKQAQKMQQDMMKMQNTANIVDIHFTKTKLKLKIPVSPVLITNE